jgi:hypothetical protein
MSTPAVALDPHARDDQKRQVLTAIVESLSETHRTAFYRFYGNPGVHSSQGRRVANLTTQDFKTTAPVKSAMMFHTPPSTIVSPCCARPSSWR